MLRNSVVNCCSRRLQTQQICRFDFLPGACRYLATGRVSDKLVVPLLTAPDVLRKSLHGATSPAQRRRGAIMKSREQDT